VSRARELLAALMEAEAGGFLAQPPGLDGFPGLGEPGIHGVPRARRWDAVASAEADGVPGAAVAFVVLPDGTIVTDEDLPDGSLVPLADAVETRLPAPYRAAALRREGDVWAIAAEGVEVVELPGLEGDVVELTLVDGEREVTVDGERTIRPLAPLDALADEHGEVALYAERVDGDLFAVDVFPL
jgi:hypothetical protein